MSKINVTTNTTNADASGFTQAINTVLDEVYPPSITESHGRLACSACDRDDAISACCDHVLEFMRGNSDAPLTVGMTVVPMFKKVALPQGVILEPWEIIVLLMIADERNVRAVHYHYPPDNQPMGDVLCLVGPYDGRYAVRTAILNDLHAVEREGQLPCGDDYHDDRFDHLYQGAPMARARLVDSYYRKYLGACYPCHLRSQSQGSVPGNLGALGNPGLSTKVTGKRR